MLDAPLWRTGATLVLSNCFEDGVMKFYARRRLLSCPLSVWFKEFQLLGGGDSSAFWRAARHFVPRNVAKGSDTTVTSDLFSRNPVFDVSTRGLNAVFRR